MATFQYKIKKVKKRKENHSLSHTSYLPALSSLDFLILSMLLLSFLLSNMPYILLICLEYCLSTPLEDKFHEARDFREILALEQAYIYNRCLGNTWTVEKILVLKLD